MHGPARYKIHNAIRDTTVRVCQEALLSPIVEPELPGGGRGDVLLRFPGPAGNRSLVVVDFAMTTIATRPRAALAAPGGAALGSAGRRFTAAFRDDMLVSFCFVSLKGRETTGFSR
jgi:hypothetical protein